MRSASLICTVDQDYRLTSFNANFDKLVTKLFNVKFKVGDNLSKILPGTRASKDYLDYWDSVYGKAFKGQKQTFITKEQNPNNQTIYIKLFINPIYDEQNNVVSLSCIANDVTQEKSYEQTLVNQTARLSAIFESGNQSMWTINSNREFTSVNETYLLAMQDIHGKKPVVGLRATDPNTDFPMLLPMPAWNPWPILQQMLPVRPQGTCAQAVSSVSLRWQCHRMLGVD